MFTIGWICGVAGPEHFSHYSALRVRSFRPPQPSVYYQGSFFVPFLARVVEVSEIVTFVREFCESLRSRTGFENLGSGPVHCVK